MKRFLLILVVHVLLSAPLSHADWTLDGLPLDVGGRDQDWPQVIEDGVGGVIISWTVAEPGWNISIRMQRLDAHGQELWVSGGIVAFSGPANLGSLPAPLVADGSGGVIIAWSDSRNADNDIYAQRVDSDGNLLWGPNGTAVCTAPAVQYKPQVTDDGLGGAYVSWLDTRHGVDFTYVMKVGSDGLPQWGGDGIPVATYDGWARFDFHAVSLGLDGVALVFVDGNSGVIYAQKINFFGTREWTNSGRAVGPPSGGQQSPSAISDGSGGIIATWSDPRGGDLDIYAQRIRSDGVPQWATDGERLCSAPLGQYFPQLASDGTGGAIVVWHDDRNGSNKDIYARRIDSDGSPLWFYDGVPVATGGASQHSPRLISDGEAGAILVWESLTSGGVDLVVQRLDANGRQIWSPGGVSLCEAGFDQTDVAFALDGTGGVITAWNDARNTGSSSSTDVYIQRIEPDFGTWGHPEAVIASVADVPDDQGGFVAVNWDASQHDNLTFEGITHYSVWRATDALPGGKSEVLLVNDPGALGQDFDGVAYWIPDGAKSSFYWEWLANQDAIHLEGYSFTAATRADSVLASSNPHYFKIVSHDLIGLYVSQEDSGHSVDNLAPGMPAMFLGEASLNPGGLTLTWATNLESDLFGYALYRGTDEGFVPGPGNLISSPPDTNDFDSDWQPGSGYHYKLSALDIRGNESPHALLSPNGLSDTPSVPLGRNHLAQNSPNPFNPATKVSFEVERNGPVLLRVYDVTGRLVETLVDEVKEAGRHEVVWRGRDSTGHTVASGVYLYQMRSDGQTLTKSMVLQK